MHKSVTELMSYFFAAAVNIFGPLPSFDKFKKSTLGKKMKLFISQKLKIFNF